MEWHEVLERKPLLLHLGGSALCHPHPRYQGHVSVDINPPREGWAVRHDLRERLPIPDGSVDGVHSEDFFEHIDEASIVRLLAECHRVLKPNGRLRIGCPDYNNPKDLPFKHKGRDDRFPAHVTFTTRQTLEALIQRSPFSRYHFYQYWDNGRFIQEPVDYTHGWIGRTPENDPRCGVFREEASAQDNYKRLLKTVVRDTLFMIKKRFRPTNLEYNSQLNHPLHITSLVVDVFKDGPSS